MTIWDDRILETIRSDQDKVGRVSELAKEETIRISRSSVSRRCKILQEHGLLRKIGDGVYILTEQGEKYLDGEINTYENQSGDIPDKNDGDGSSFPSENP